MNNRGSEGRRSGCGKEVCEAAVMADGTFLSLWNAGGASDVPRGSPSSNQFWHDFKLWHSVVFLGP